METEDLDNEVFELTETVRDLQARVRVLESRSQRIGPGTVVSLRVEPWPVRKVEPLDMQDSYAKQDEGLTMQQALERIANDKSLRAVSPSGDIWFNRYGDIYTSAPREESVRGFCLTQDDLRGDWTVQKRGK